MDNIKILDVTLRDGGIVNNFEFGNDNMNAILSAIEDSGVKNIELGYLEMTKGTLENRSQFKNEEAIKNVLLKNKKSDVKYYAMFDYSKFDPNLLVGKTDSGIDGIRFAFHKRNFNDVKPIYEKLISLGYEVFMQPMVTMHYTDEELEKLIQMANSLDIKGIYFVDTFGQMKANDVERLVNFFDQRLRKDIALGFHAHNNIQLAYANAIAFIDMDIDRVKMIDASIMGMGRGAGNLNTELILPYLNKYNNASYNVNPILEVCDSVLNNIKQKTDWGYSVEYALSSFNDVSPIFAKYYKEKYNLSLNKINEILTLVEGANRISFKENYADEVYKKYMNM